MDETGGRRALAVFALAARSRLLAVPLPAAAPCLALANGARRVAVAQGSQVFVYDPHTGTRVAVLEGHAADVDDLGWPRRRRRTGRSGFGTPRRAKRLPPSPRSTRSAGSRWRRVVGGWPP